MEVLYRMVYAQCTSMHEPLILDERLLIVCTERKDKVIATNTCTVACVARAPPGPSPGICYKRSSRFRL